MVLYSRKRPLNLAPSVLLMLMLASFAGCAEPNGEQPADKGVDRDGANEGLHTELSSAHDFLGPGDVEKFVLGRARTEILKDVQWRGNFLMAGEYKGGSVCAISYKLFSEGTEKGGGEVLIAIFVDKKFVKFVKWFSGERILVDVAGTPTSRPKPIQIGEIKWLIQAVESEAVNLAELEKEVKARPETPSQIDPGLTIAFLLLRATALRGSKIFAVASEEDYKRNAELRDQYNASRLQIGMTQSEVEAVLKAKPIESGEVEAGSFIIYGSNESFRIDSALHFSNILVLFRKGKANVIDSAVPGEGWRRKLKEVYVDFPR